MNLKDLGFQVKAARREAGLSQLTLAKAAGLPRETLSRLEKGRLNEFGVRKLCNLLSVLKLDLSFQKKGTAGNLDDLKKEVMK